MDICILLEIEIEFIRIWIWIRIRNWVQSIWGSGDDCFAVSLGSLSLSWIWGRSFNWNSCGYGYCFIGVCGYWFGERDLLLSFIFPFQVSYVEAQFDSLIKPDGLQRSGIAVFWFALSHWIRIYQIR